MQEKHGDISSRPAMGEPTAQRAKPAEHDCREAALDHVLKTGELPAE